MKPRKCASQERSRATVDALIEATACILVTQGFDKASTNRIAEKASVSIGSLYHRIATPDVDGPRYANHCLHCGAEQDDQDLHAEPDAPFFDIPHAAPGALRLTPLAGEVCLSGDEHFTIE